MSLDAPGKCLRPPFGVAIGGTSGGEIAAEQLAQLGARIVLIARDGQRQLAGYRVP